MQWSGQPGPKIASTGRDLIENHKAGNFQVKSRVSRVRHLIPVKSGRFRSWLGAQNGKVASNSETILVITYIGPCPPPMVRG